jgi:hypothetical protein
MKGFKMSKIKFKLVKFEKALAFQIFEMDERFRVGVDGVDGTVNKFVSKMTNVEVRSRSKPCLENDFIWLRGYSKKLDYCVSIIEFENNKVRDKFHEKILITLKDWAENWEGFKEEEKEMIDYSKGIFEF